METLDMLLDRYGMVLKVPQIAECLGLEIGTVRNRITLGTFPIPTYREGKIRLADVRDVAEYLDMKRAAARAELEKDSATTLEQMVAESLRGL